MTSSWAAGGHRLGLTTGCRHSISHRKLALRITQPDLLARFTHEAARARLANRVAGHRQARQHCRREGRRYIMRAVRRKLSTRAGRGLPFLPGAGRRGGTQSPVACSFRFPGACGRLKCNRPNPESRQKVRCSSLRSRSDISSSFKPCLFLNTVQSAGRGIVIAISWNHHCGRGV